MVLYKIINGVRTELSAQEEQELRDEWAANEAAQQQAEQAEQAKQALIGSAQTKIATTSLLSSDEQQAYFGVTY